MKGRPVGEPGALASLRRVRREGNPTLCRRPWPFERGTGAATPNGRRYFLELRYISHWLPPFGNGPIDSRLSRCRHVPARWPTKKPRRLISPRGSFRRVLSGRSLGGDASAHAGRSLIRRKLQQSKDQSISSRGWSIQKTESSYLGAHLGISRYFARVRSQWRSDRVVSGRIASKGCNVSRRSGSLRRGRTRVTNYIVACGNCATSLEQFIDPTLLF